MIDFGKLIDKHLERDFKPKTVGRYYPSEIGNCLRKIWFSYRKPKELNKEKMKVFQAGLMIHDFVAEVLRSEKTPEVRLLKSETPFRLEFPEFLVSGRVDDILMVERSQKKLLVEVKSIKMLNMVKEPAKPHVTQLQLYMHALKIMNGLILYIEKPSLQTREFLVDYDPDQIGEIMERFKRLHNYLKTGSIPEPEAKQVEEISWMCRYCDYQEECEKETV